LDICWFRGDELDIIDKKLPNSVCLKFKGDELDIIVNEKVILGYLLVQRLFDTEKGAGVKFP